MKTKLIIMGICLLAAPVWAQGEQAAEAPAVPQKETEDRGQETKVSGQKSVVSPNDTPQNKEFLEQQMPVPVAAAEWKALVAQVQVKYPGIDTKRVVFLGRVPGADQVMVIYLDRNNEPVKNVVTLEPETGRTGALGQAQGPKTETGGIGEEGPAKESKGLNQDGRVYFMMHTAVKALVVYPATFGALFPDANEQSIMGLGILTAGGSLYGAYKYTRKMELGYGRVAMMIYGGELALTYGTLAKVFIENGTGLDEEPIQVEVAPGVFEEEDPKGIQPSEYAMGLIQALGFPLGIHAGSKFSLIGNTQYGNAAIMRFLGRAGVGFGYALPVFFMEPGQRNFDEDYAAASALAAMFLIPAGNYAGLKLVQGKDYSSGRGFLVETSGIMGGLTGALLTTLWEEDDDDVIVAASLAGFLGGTAFGLKFREPQRYKFSQGVFMAASAAGGALVGLSLPLIGQADMRTSHQAYTIAGVLGAWGGLVLGEKLALSIFDTDRPEPSLGGARGFSLQAPVLWQWPRLLQKRVAAGAGKVDIFTVDYSFK